MLLYDLPLLKQSLSQKCLCGLFTKPHQLQLLQQPLSSSSSSKQQQSQWLGKKNYQIIICKSSSFQLYKFKKTFKLDKIDLSFQQSVDVYGEISNIEVMKIKLENVKENIKQNTKDIIKEKQDKSNLNLNLNVNLNVNINVKDKQKQKQTKEYIDILIVTLNTGQLVVYYYNKQTKSFAIAYKDIIFPNNISQNNNKNNNHNPLIYNPTTPQPLPSNPRHIGTYITCSQQNHFLISSIRCYRKLYFISSSIINDNKLKIIIKSSELHIKENHICWNMIWLPSMVSESNQFLGKYVAIQKEVVNINNSMKQNNYNNMVDQSQEEKYYQKKKKLKYYYIQKNANTIINNNKSRILQKQQKRQQFKQLKDSTHLLIPLTCSSFFILYQNRLTLKQLSAISLLSQQPPTSFPVPTTFIIDLKLPLRQALVDKNLQTIFTYYSRQPKQSSEGNKNKIYLINQFGDLFQIEYVLINNMLANFNIKYTNSIRTVHSFVYVGEVESMISVNQKNRDSQKDNQKNKDNNKDNKDNKDSSINQLKQGGRISLSQTSQPVLLSYQSASLLLFGLQRFSTSLFFLPPSHNIQHKPKQIKVHIRQTTKSKSTKSFPQYSDPQFYIPIIQKSRDLDLSDKVQHMGVMVDMKVVNLSKINQNAENKHMGVNQDKKSQKNDIYEIYALTNGGNLRHEEHFGLTSQNVEMHKSQIKIFKKGLKVKQTNSLTYQRPLNMFSFKKYQKDTFHKIIIVCVNGKTHIFTNSPDNNSLSTYKQLSFDQNSTSCYIGKFQDQSYIQVLTNKLRHVKRQKTGHKDYQLIKNKIINGICLGRQLFIVLFGGQIMYYQLQKQKDTLQIKKQFYLSDQIISIQLTPLQIIKKQPNLTHQKRISKYLIIATKNYQLIIFKITKSDKDISNNYIQKVYEQKIKCQIESVAATIGYTTDDGVGMERTYQVFLGLQNGTVVKMEFDKNMNKNSQKVYQIGYRPCKVKRCSLGSKRQDSILIISDKTYVYYSSKSKPTLSLIASQNIQLAIQLKHPQNPNNLLTYSQSKIRFLSIQSFGQQFHQQKIDIFLSGKKLLLFQNNMGVIQADLSYQYQDSSNNKNTSSQSIQLLQNSIIQVVNLKKIWKSYFQIYKLTQQNKRVSVIYFDQTKQICLSVAYCNIKSGNNKGGYLVFGCAEGIEYYPKFETRNQSIKIYNWDNLKNIHQFLYHLNIDAIPLVLEPFIKGEKFLAGIGKTLRLYEIGRKKLLLKAELKNLTSNINQIKTYGKKIFITSVSDSFHLFKYIPEQQTFYDISEDSLPKFITAMNVIDSQTVCAGDKFGNLILGRLSENAKNDFENMASISSNININNNNNNISSQLSINNLSRPCISKFHTIARLNIGDIVTSITKTFLYNSKTQVILYSTIMGQLRILYPLTELQQLKILPIIEQKLKKKYKINKEIQGNNLGANKNVINGQLVEKFVTLGYEEQVAIIKEIPQVKIQDIDRIKQIIEGIRTKII